MTLVEMIAEVRAAADQETSDQVGVATYRRWVDQEYQHVRRLIGDLVPTLYMGRVSFTIASGSNSWTITPGTWSKLYRLETDGGPGNYVPLCAADPLDPERIPLGFTKAVLERQGVLDVYPEATAPGNYRATYVIQPARLSTAGADDGASIEVPAEFERVIVERAAVRVRMRLEEDPTPHLKAAEDALREAKWYLRQRYGVMPQLGVTTT